MNHAIVLNTLTGAVSEYSNFNFHSITPTHGGSVTGLYVLEGDLDYDAPIVSVVTTGKTLWGTTLKKSLDMIYLAIHGTGNAELTVFGNTQSYTYPFQVRPAGESRCKPGMGISENYMAFSFSNIDGADFRLDRIEVSISRSTTRRT